MLTSVGLAPNSKTREQLIRAWAVQETSSHWGEGSPQTNFRATEGSGDEYGSISFSQLLFQFRYSYIPIKIHKDYRLNLYDPLENVKAFAVHTAAKPYASGDLGLAFNHTGAFYSAFAEGNFAKAYEADTGLYQYRHCNINTTDDCKNATRKAVGKADDEGVIKEDRYEQLTRAIGYYNLATNLGNSWPDTLKAIVSTDCPGCKYALALLHEEEKYALPYRQYIWKVGDGAEAYCFAYGEQEWLRGENWNDVKDDVANGLREEASCN
jgi:hypothetical protein